MRNWPFRKHPSPERQSEMMRADWDRRARENARHFIATEREQWSDEEFFASGARTVEQQILTDMPNICQGKPPEAMRVLEIGCGAGRITRSLAEIFGEVHAVDVSGEMVGHARRALSPFPHAHLYRNNGLDLNVVPDLPFDFAFSTLVFQHIPSDRIVEGYMREVHRLLRPGGLFKFQLNGGFRLRLRHRLLRFLFRSQPRFRADPNDTWMGARFSSEQAQALAGRCGFECRYREGEGTQEFWLWFFKPE